MFAELACRILKHRVDRRRVWNDGLDFRTACGRCSVPLLRDAGGWREFDAPRDDNPRRAPHPRQREL
jgi:hypothetical protein